MADFQHTFMYNILFLVNMRYWFNPLNSEVWYGYRIQEIYITSTEYIKNF